MVVVSQRFGDRVNRHIHLHAMAGAGAFEAEGVFHSMPLETQEDTGAAARGHMARSCPRRWGP